MDTELYLSVCAVLVGAKHRASRDMDRAAKAEPYDKIRHEYLRGETAKLLVILGEFQKWFKGEGNEEAKP